MDVRQRAAWLGVFCAAVAVAMGAELLQAAGASSPTVQCVGEKAASHGLIYLHGIDPVTISKQELDNRKLLTRLAAESGAALAIVRSTALCPREPFKGKLCWPMATAAEVEMTLSQIEKAADACFSPATKRTFIGFSNGGFLLNKAVLACVKTGAEAFLSVGSAGSFSGRETKGGVECGRLHLLIGKSDKFQKPGAERLYKHLAALGRDVALTEFDGGHVVPEGPTRQILASLRKPAGGTADPAETAASESHCDLPGHDLRSLPQKDAAACRQTCLDDKACKAYTFISGWNRCFLKKRLSRKHRVQFYAGHIDVSADGTRTSTNTGRDVDYSGKDIRKVPNITSAQACGDACLAEQACAAFVYIDGYQDCWLKSARGKMSKKIFYCGVR